MFYPGHNEKLLGKALASFRQNVVHATKFHISQTEIQENMVLYDFIHNHLENSMKRLQTDYIDLYYLHRLNESIPVEEVAEVMGRLIQEGVIAGFCGYLTKGSRNYIGFSSTEYLFYGRTGL